MPHNNIAVASWRLPASRIDVLLNTIDFYTRTIKTLGIETCLVLVDRNALHFTVPED